MIHDMLASEQPEISHFRERIEVLVPGILPLSSCASTLKKKKIEIHQVLWSLGRTATRR